MKAFASPRWLNIFSLLALVFPLLLPLPTQPPQPGAVQRGLVQDSPEVDEPPGHEHELTPARAVPVPLAVLGPDFSARLPDLVPLPPTRLQIVFPRGDEKRLRFDTTFVNQGSGPVELYGAQMEGGEHTAVEVTQWVLSRNGVPLQVPMGLMIYHAVHVHWHWENFAHYGIWSWKDEGGPDELLVSGEKISFCLRDITYTGPQSSPAARKPAYVTCGWQKQGLSAGWTDNYERHLDGQSLEITDLPDGRYALVITANPDGLLVEASLRNNQAYSVFSIREGRLDIGE